MCYRAMSSSRQLQLAFCLLLAVCLASFFGVDYLKIATSPPLPGVSCDPITSVCLPICSGFSMNSEAFPCTMQSPVGILPAVSKHLYVQKGFVIDGCRGMRQTVYTRCLRGLTIIPVNSGTHFASVTDRGYDSSRYGTNHSQSNVGYWIALTYGGQMTRAIKNMAVHQCLGGTMAGVVSTQIKIVEPFSQDSRLFHSPTFWSMLENNHLHNASRFSDYYDLDHYNARSEERKSATLVKWEEFLKKAPRETVVVVTTPQGCKSFKNQSRGTTCPLHTACEPSSKHASLLSGLRRYGFFVVRTVCLACQYISRPLTVDELRREIYSNGSTSELTVVFAAQQSFGSVKTWVRMPQHCNLVEKVAADLGLTSSKLILKHRNVYLTEILKSEQAIAVMFRIERMFQTKAQEDLLPCLNATVSLHHRLELQRSMENISTFITLDIGQFGSRGMQVNRNVNKLAGVSEVALKRIIQKTISELYKGPWSLEEWEEGFVRATGGKTERGYIAMLQQSIAAHSDCLILMGGGSYQEVTGHQYISYHSKPCLHTLCAKERWESWERSSFNTMHH